MTSKICRVAVSLILLAFACDLSIAHAETVVRKDRTHRNEIISSARNMPRDTREMKENDTVLPAVKEKAKDEMADEIKDEFTVDDDEDKASSHTNDFFDDFKQDEPKLQFSVFDLEMGSSYMDYQSAFSYRNTEKNQYLGIYLVKRRLAGVLEANYDYILTCSYSLDVHPRVSKKNPASLEYNINGKIEQVPLKIQFYSDNYFSAKDMNKIIQSLPKNLTNLKIVMSTREGIRLQVPVMELAVEQWRTVITADLKQLKKEYDS